MLPLVGGKNKKNIFVLACIKTLIKSVICMKCIRHSEILADVKSSLASHMKRFAVKWISLLSESLVKTVRFKQPLDTASWMSKK